MTTITSNKISILIFKSEIIGKKEEISREFIMSRS